MSGNTGRTMFFAVLLGLFAGADALAVHIPRGWLEKDRFTADPSDTVLKGKGDGHSFVIHRPGMWPNGANLLVFTAFDGYCSFYGREEGMRLSPVSAGKIIRAAFGKDKGLEIGLFDRSFKLQFSVKVSKPAGDAWVWASLCPPERASEVLAAHLAMGTALAQETPGIVRILRRYSRTIEDPLYTYLFGAFGKDREWISPRWDNQPEEIDPPKHPHRPHDRPGPKAQPFPEPQQPQPQPQPEPQPKPEPPPFNPPPPATPQKIEALIRSIDAASFSGDKLSILGLFINDNWVSVESAARILSRFAFSSDRLKALESMAQRLTDRDNSFMLLNSFEFSSDKEAARKILENARK